MFRRSRLVIAVSLHYTTPDNEKAPWRRSIRAKVLK
jgi:hypothetical protein